ncbi:hypothetical protein HOG98_06970 [bacterium]|jgi:hypothetical protein|nr:hypothetical protein [bacterium]
MNREVSVYTMIVGLTIYCVVVGAFLLNPIWVNFKSGLTSDRVVFSCFMTIIFLPISYGCMRLANKKLQLVKPWLMGLICVLPIGLGLLFLGIWNL